MQQLRRIEPDALRVGLGSPDDGRIMNAKAHPALDIDRLAAFQPVVERAVLRQPSCRDVALDRVAVGQFQDLLALATRHLSVEKNCLVLDEAPLKARGVVAADIGFLRKNVEISNLLLSKRLLKLGKGTTLLPASPYFWSGSIFECQAWEAWADVHWWGWSLCMNKELTWAIATELAAGASAATILVLLEACGVITAVGVIPTAIVGLIMSVGAAVLFASEHGNGVCIYQLWFPPGQVVVLPR